MIREKNHEGQFLFYEFFSTRQADKSQVDES